MIVPLLMIGLAIMVFVILTARLLWWTLRGYDVASKMAEYQAKLEAARMKMKRNKK